MQQQHPSFVAIIVSDLHPHVVYREKINKMRKRKIQRKPYFIFTGR